MAKQKHYKPAFLDKPEEEQPTESPEPAPLVGRKKKGMSAVRSDLSKITENDEVLDIWERRMLNPQQQSAPMVRIKTPGMTLRWINLNNRGRYQRARYEQGWLPVEQAELIDEKEIYGVSYTTEGFVCRGEKQQEMLMKMPTAVFRKIQERRAELNTKSYKNLKENLVSAGSRHFGDKYNAQAGQQAADAAAGFTGNISFGTERATSDEFVS
jgi:hypothetical protein